MAIFDRAPQDWRDLQNMTGQLFEEIGCEVKVEAKLENVRGAKEIDVRVVDGSVAPPILILCECKHWKRRVDQETVHAFRTVMHDTGAHRGFIVSSAGFQKGAIEARQNTNIELVAFDELQALFEDRWRDEMAESFAPYADELFPYWDPSGGRMPTFQWQERHRERQNALMHVYEPFVTLALSAGLREYHRDFPISVPAISCQGMIEGRIQIGSYRQLYDFLDRNKEAALYHFRVLHGEIEPRTTDEYNPLI